MKLQNILLAFIVFPILLFGCSHQINTVHPPLVKTDSTESKSVIHYQIDPLLTNPIFKEAYIGIMVVDLKTGKTIYELNSNKLFRPASNLKLFTTYTALSLLQKDFIFQTQVISDGSIYTDTLKGNLYLKGFGDPLLTAEDLDTLAQNISKNVKTISGDLIGDISYFDDNYWGKGWMWDDEPEAFGASISALSINSNIIKLFITPGNKIGDPVKIKTEPQTDLILISNTATTSNNILPPELSVSRNWKERDNRITVSGSMPIRSNEEIFSLSIWKPELFALNLFRERLEKHGVIIHGKTYIDTTCDGKLFFQTKRPLDSVIFKINKFSNNLAAENLLKTLGAELYGKPGSAEKGIAAIKRYISPIGVDTTKVILADGSGASRYNLLSPLALVTLLQQVYNNKIFFDRFYSSLPIAGADGNLKNRFLDSNTKNKIYAKTGTASDAVALSGYINTAHSDTLVFSILINNFTGNSKQYRDIIDKICELLISVL